MKKEKVKKTTEKKEDVKIGRRKFLKKAAVAGAAGAATIGFPMVSRAQTTVSEDARRLGRQGYFQRLCHGRRQTRQ